MIHEARAIPEAGQVFTFHRFRFEVQRKVRNRLTTLRVVPATALTTGVAAGAATGVATREK